MNSLRIGLIGCGKQMRTNHLPCLAFIPEVELAAVCDLQADLAQAVARKYAVGACHTDYKRMLAEEHLDAAIIVGTPELHAEAGEACLRAGLHVFLEKPCAPTVAQARHLARVARECGRFGMVGFQKRFSTAYSIVKNLLTGGEFGRPSFIDVKFSQGAWDDRWGQRSLLGMLMMQGTHIFDLIRFLAGDIVELYAKCGQRSEALFGFAVTFETSCGAVGIMNLNSYEIWDALDERLVLSGEGHYVTVNDMLHLHYYPPKTWAELPGRTVINAGYDWLVSGGVVRGDNQSRVLIGFQGELEHFVRSILTNVAPSPSLDDGAESMRIGEAILESAQSNRPVKL